jgi:FKBP-type peptidyl-prolyl cis-trans isomerase
MMTLRALGAAALTVALSLPCPAFAAAAPKPPAKPVLTCKVKGTDGFSYTVLTAGKGDKPGADARVVVNYSGRLAADGKEFDTGSATKFKVGGVIPGFAQGLQLMQPGAKYRLCIPAALGYGADGVGEDIPPNADLVFEVELLSFTTPPPKPIIPAQQRTCDLTATKGMRYAIADTGNGRSPTMTDMVLLDITSFDPKNGTVLNKADWIKVILAQVSPDLGEILGKIQSGGTVRICVPDTEPVEGGAAEPPATYEIVQLVDVRPAISDE